MIGGTAKPAYAEAELRSAQPDAVCYNENVLLEIWRAQKVITHIEYGDAKVKVIVDHRAWYKSRITTRSEIALAAYCKIHVQYGKGTVDVTDVTGFSYGTVKDGYWHDSLTD